MNRAMALAGAYLLGSIPFGFLVARAKGIDLRTFGSGNIGATNAMRAVGKPLGILVFLLDAAKGFAPAWLAGAGPRWALGMGAASMLGHTFPVWLGFKGGKGVATGCGVWLAVAPAACGASLLTFLLALKVTRYVSLSAVLACFSLPVALKALREPEWLVVAALAMAALIAILHRANFVRIAAGVEPRSGEAT